MLSPDTADPSAPGPSDLRAVELVETWPRETTLDHPDIADTATVWLEMFAGAEESIDLGEFYGATAPGSALEPILEALEAAVARGVRVRLLIDAKFYARQPEVADRLGAAGVEVRRLDLSELGGVMHAKYFVVDGRAAYIGSANFDWRSLAHIHELGVRLREPALIAAVRAIWAKDWSAADADPPAIAAAPPPDPVDRAPAPPLPSPPPIAPRSGSGQVELAYAGHAHRLALVASPRDLLPDPASWDLPRLLGMIDSAKRQVQIQLLSYALVGYDGARFDGIDLALRAAAARGVQVELLVADWNKRPPALADLQSLQRVPGIQVRMATIPPASDGFIPFARVIHSKLMIVDGQTTWIGTSNFSGDYFYKSRNLGVIVDGAPFAADVGRIFRDLWGSTYVYELDPDAEYEPPQVAPPEPAAD